MSFRLANYELQKRGHLLAFSRKSARRLLQCCARLAGDLLRRLRSWLLRSRLSVRSAWLTTFIEGKSSLLCFGEQDSDHPEVLALRSDFPSVPHLFIAEDEVPRRICLYEQPFENERLNWTPARFLKRIRFWLANTAVGSLHAEDQPLEPLIQGALSRIIVQSDMAFSDLENKPGLLAIYRIVVGDEAGLTLVAHWQDASNPPEVHAVAAVFSSPPQAHGIMHRQPVDLHSLHHLCIAAGLDLAAQLASKFASGRSRSPPGQSSSRNS